MLQMVESGMRGRIDHTIHQYPKANNEYTKYYIKNKESSHLMYGDANKLYRWAMSQKLSVKIMNQKKHIKLR